MTEKFDYIEEIETFLRRLRDGEFVFTSKATEVTYVFRPSIYDGPLQLRLKTMPLSDCLNNTLNDYNLAWQEPEKRKLAKECHKWIQTAWISGAIQEGQGLTKKLEECKSENIRLQKELEELSAEYLKKQRQIEELEGKWGLDNRSKKE